MNYLFIAATTNTLNDVKQTLEHKFKMKDLGKVSLFLGIEFEHEIDKMALYFTRYCIGLACRTANQNIPHVR